MTLLAFNNKLKPTIIRTIIENKFNVYLNEKEHDQTCGFVTIKRKLLRDACEENTISGIAAFANKNKWHEGLVDGDAHVANFDVSR